nr:ulp1 protease family, C-terminal catalytic domain-containing protein [Tanacetum cinerariifolium]
MIKEKFSRISKEKAEVETLLRDANKEFSNDENPKPAAVKTKEAAEKPEPVKNVKEFAEKPKEPAEKAHEAPQNVKQKPAAVKTKEAAEKPKPAENIKEVAEKPKEPAEKAQEAPQYVKPKPTAMKTKEAAEKRKPAENVKELAEKPKKPAEGNIDWVGEVIDSISAAYLDDELHDWPRVFEPINMVQPSTPKRVFSSPSKGYVKPVKTVNTPYMCRRIDVTARYNSYSGYGYASKYKEAYDPLKKLFSRYLKEQNNSSHEAVAKMRPFIPKLKWRTSNNLVDCGVFAMIHMENYVGDAAKNWEFGLCEESDEQLLMLQRMRYKIATKIMLHQFNAVSNKMFDFAFTFETKYTE